MANTKAHCGQGMTSAAIPVVNGDWSYLPGIPSQMRTPETWMQFKIGMAGTFSRLGFGNLGATGTATVTFRKNTANGNETKASTANTTGWFEDTTHTDVVAQNDILDLAWAGTATLPQIFGQKYVFDGGASGLVNLVSNPVSSFSATGTYFLPILGGSTNTNQSTVEANAQHKVRAPGTLSYFQACGRGSNTAITFTLRKNGANGNSTITIAANTTGIVVDTTHTDTLADGDLVCFTSGALTTPGAGFPHGACITQSGGTYDWGGYFGTARAASATNNFFSPLGGGGGASTTTVGFPISYANTGNGFQKARVQVSANTYTTSTTWQFRKNNANANNACTITNATTGWFEDTTHTDTFADGDVFDYLWTGGTSGSATIQTYAITIDNGTDAPVAPPWPNFLLNQIAAVGY